MSLVLLLPSTPPRKLKVFHYQSLHNLKDCPTDRGRQPLGLPISFPGRSPISSASHTRCTSGLAIPVAFTQPSSYLSMCSWNWEGWKPSERLSVPRAKIGNKHYPPTKGCAPVTQPRTPMASFQSGHAAAPCSACCLPRPQGACQQSYLPAVSHSL